MVFALDPDVAAGAAKALTATSTLVGAKVTAASARAALVATAKAVMIAVAGAVAVEAGKRAVDVTQPSRSKYSLQCLQFETGRGPRCRRHSCTGVDCVDGICIGPQCFNSNDHNGGGCEGNGCPNGGEGESGGGDNPDESCSEKKTASTCITTTSSTTVRPAGTWTTWSFSDCQTNTGCSVTDSSSSTTIEGTYGMPGVFPVATEYFELSPNKTELPTTVLQWEPPGPTDFINCSHQDEDPGQGITKAYCVCDGSTFAESVATNVTPYNSCGYTTKPTKTSDGNTLPATTNTFECKVCSVVGHNNNVCTSLPNCVPQTTQDPEPTNVPNSESWNVGFYTVSLTHHVCISYVI